MTTATSRLNGPQRSGTGGPRRRARPSRAGAPRGAGAASTRNPATRRIGRSGTSEAFRPNARTSGVMTSGPVAIPRFPPVEKMLMPVARRSPEASAAARDPSGWNAATPRPWNATAAAMSG